MSFKAGDLVRLVRMAANSTAARRGVPIGLIGEVSEVHGLTLYVAAQHEGIAVRLMGPASHFRKVGDEDDRTLVRWADCIWRPKEVAI